MNIILGKVSKIIDPLKFIIEFTSKGLIESCIAYPIDTFDEPNEGDEVLLYEIESIFGYSYLWKKVRLFDHTRMKLKESIVDIFEDHIEIHTGETKSIITLNNSGEITIKSESKVIVETKEAEVKASSSCKIDTPDCTITGGKLNVKGTVAPTGSGPFCGITVCPFVGAPHVGPSVTGT